MTKKALVLIIISLFSESVISTNDLLEEYFSKLKNQEFHESYKITNKISDDNLKSSLILLLDVISKHSRLDKDIKITSKDNNELKFIKHLTKGYLNTFSKNQNNLEAYNHFSEALKIGNHTKQDYLVKASLIALLDLFKREIFIGGKQYQLYLNQFGEIKSDPTDEALFILYEIIFYSKEDQNLQINYNYYTSVHKLDSIFSLIPKNHQLYTLYYFEKAIQYKIDDDYYLSELFFLKADSTCANKTFLKPLKNTISWQLADLNINARNIDAANKYLDIYKKSVATLEDSFYDYRLSSRLYKKENKHDFAFVCLKESVDIEYSLGYKNNSLESSILSVQNQTDKLKLDKIESEAKQIKNKNIAFALGALLLFGSIVFFLIQKNTKRKQLLAEQSKALETQKLTTVLKEQELTSIDAMIEGQEKERQRIANDLHDDLGGLMATVKMHFNVLKEKQSPELYDKTNKLLDDAYNKVRSVAHAKNSGVMAKKGLLKAIKDMAKTVSASNKLQVDVIDHGLENRLENSLELTIFRIIQELITNVIKHAEATEATIHITNHDDSLNIMVEDNGKGFDTKKLAKKSGMGIHSIDKRVENLGGTVTLESELKKGTTIIIDIPS